MDEQDEAYDQFDGRTPDHIILSKEIYDQLDEKNRFETLKENYPPKRPGYLGMKVWWSDALDSRDKAALLISDDVFQQIAPTVSDLKESAPKDF